MAKGIRKQGAASIMASGFFRLAVYACIIFAVIFVGKSAYDFGYAIFNEVPMAEGEGTDITVVIKDGSSVYQIGKILKKKGLIEDAKVFVVPVSYTHLDVYKRQDQIRHVLKGVDGEFDVVKERGRIYVFARGEYDYEETVEALKRVFGIFGICPAVVLQDQGYEELAKAVVSYTCLLYTSMPLNLRKCWTAKWT